MLVIAGKFESEVKTLDFSLRVDSIRLMDERLGATVRTVVWTHLRPRLSRNLDIPSAEHIQIKIVSSGVEADLDTAEYNGPHPLSDLISQNDKLTLRVTPTQNKFYQPVVEYTDMDGDAYDLLIPKYDQFYTTNTYHLETMKYCAAIERERGERVIDPDGVPMKFDWETGEVEVVQAISEFLRKRFYPDGLAIPAQLLQVEIDLKNDENGAQDHDGTTSDRRNDDGAACAEDANNSSANTSKYEAFLEGRANCVTVCLHEIPPPTVDSLEQAMEIFLAPVRNKAFRAWAIDDTRFDFRIPPECGKRRKSFQDEFERPELWGFSDVETNRFRLAWEEFEDTIVETSYEMWKEGSFWETESYRYNYEGPVWLMGWWLLERSRYVLFCEVFPFWKKEHGAVFDESTPFSSILCYDSDFLCYNYEDVRALFRVPLVPHFPEVELGIESSRCDAVAPERWLVDNDRRFEPFLRITEELCEIESQMAEALFLYLVAPENLRRMKEFSVDVLCDTIDAFIYVPQELREDISFVRTALDIATERFFGEDRGTANGWHAKHLERIRDIRVWIHPELLREDAEKERKFLNPEGKPRRYLPTLDRETIANKKGLSERIYDEYYSTWSE